MPSGLSSERAAAFSPLTNSLSTSGSSLMMRTRLTGFFMERCANTGLLLQAAGGVFARGASHAWPRGSGKGRPSGPAPGAPYPGIAFNRTASRLLCRAASFLWMTFLSAMRSMIPVASLKVFRAAALSPAAIALVTLLIALVNAERRLALCLRRFSAWRAALRAPFVCGGGVLGGLREGDWGTQDPPWRLGNEAARGSHRVAARSCAPCGDGTRRRSGADHHLRECPGVRSFACEVQSHGGNAARHLSLHSVHLSRFARRRHPQYVEPVRDTGADPGAPQPLVYFRGAVFITLFRAAGDGARLGGIRRRRAAARAASSGARKNRHAAATETVLFGPGGSANSAADGAGRARRFRRPGQPAYQHHIRFVSRGRQRLLALLCGPADGIPHRAAWRGARNDPAPKLVQVSLRFGPKRIFETSRLGPGPDVHPRGAGGRGTVLALGAARDDLVSLRAIRRARRMDDPSRADRLQRGTARTHSRKSAGARLLCAAEYCHAGPNRHRNPGRHPAHERRPDRSPQARGTCARDRARRLSQRWLALPQAP